MGRDSEDTQSSLFSNLTSVFLLMSLSHVLAVEGILLSLSYFI